MKTIITIFTLALILISACQNKQNEAKPAHDNSLEQLVGYMTGSFSSQAQSEADSNFFDIRLEMVPIWTERTDGYWLYVEQAVADYVDKPYRQRVYHVTQNDTGYASEVYTFEEPLRFARAWETGEVLAGLTVDSLTIRSGCTIYLKKADDSTFVGATNEADCESSLRGAAYATSEVNITPNLLYSWDRGYDSTGTQVWGAEIAGYNFDKLVVEETTAN